MNGEDRDLGMGRAISRRDFVQGVAAATALSGALGGASAALAQPAPNPEAYPPLRTGMRGSHPGSFEVSHALRDGLQLGAATSTREVYDLVVVGGGLSGLAAAYFYRQKAGPSAKILILDNHDDFGGHAKRNEFFYKGRQYLTNGGSDILVAPPTWTPEAIAVIDQLGVDWRKTARDRPSGLQSDLPLGPATYFNKGYYGRDQLVVGGTPENPTAEFLARTPLTPQMQAEVLRLRTGTTDYMAGLSKEEKYAKLRSMSYRDYLLNVAKFSPELLNYTRGAWCVGNDMCSAWFAFFRYRPGFNGLGLERPHGSPESPEHVQADFDWICGNSDLARLLVRSLIPAALPPGDWTEVVTKRVNYATLDQSSSPTRIRLNSIVVAATHVGAPLRQFEPESREVEVAYVNNGQLESVRGKDVVMACNNNVIPYLCPDMPAQQKAALRQAVRACNQMTNVLLRNWEAFAKLKVARISCPNSFYANISLKRSGIVGDMQPVRDPSEPILASFSTGDNSGILSNPTMVKELTKGSPPAPGTPMDEQFRVVRQGLLETPFEEFERTIRRMSAGALSGGGFDPARDIVAITVNRWPHGFATGRNVLWDDPSHISPTVIAKQKFGRISICNSDAAGLSLAQAALSEAYRAVNDLEPKAYGYYEVI